MRGPRPLGGLRNEFRGRISLQSSEAKPLFAMDLTRDSSGKGEKFAGGLTSKIFLCPSSP
jgi:hypothetical protein